MESSSSGLVLEIRDQGFIEESWCHAAGAACHHLTCSYQRLKVHREARRHEPMIDQRQRGLDNLGEQLQRSRSQTPSDP